MARPAEELSDGHEIYCDVFRKVGKKVLAKIFRWHYGGGSVDYYSYLESVSFFESLGTLSPTQKYNLKNREPEEYDFHLLRILFYFTCNIFHKRKYKDKDDLYETLGACVNMIVREATVCDETKSVLSDNQMAEQLHSCLSLAIHALKTAAEIVDIPYSEYFPFVAELENIITKHPGFQKHHLNPNTGLGKAYKAIIFNVLQKSILNKREDISSVPGRFRSVSVKREKEDCQNMNELFPLGISNESFRAVKSQNRLEKIANKVPKAKKLSSPQTKSPTMHNSSKKKKHQCDVDTKPVVEANSRKTKTKPSPIENDAQSKLPIEKHLEIDTTAKQFEDDSASCSEKIDGVGSASKEIDSNECEDNSEVRNTNVVDKIEVCIKPILASICASLYESSALPIRGEVAPPSSLPSCQGVILKQHQKYSQKSGQVVELSSLLSVKGMDDNEAQIILLSGEPGMGKSWVLNYIPKIYKAGMCDDGTFKFLFSCQLENNDYSSILQLVADACKEQVENVDAKEDEILNEMLKYPTLLLLDGYHEMYESCEHLVREVLNMTDANLKVVIACRPHYVDHIYALIRKKRKKHVCHLHLVSVPPSFHVDLVSRILDNGEIFLNADVTLEHVKQGLISQLPLIYDIIGEGMCNPLMLEILTKMWTEH